MKAKTPQDLEGRVDEKTTFVEVFKKMDAINERCVELSEAAQKAAGLEGNET